MFACIFIPDFPAQALIRFQPELRDSPVAVLAGRAPLQKVIAVNERARRLGVDVGAAKPQLEVWETLRLRTRSESLEMSTHSALLDCAQSFSPEIEDTSPGTALLNLAGLEPLLGSLQKIAHDLAQRLSQMGVEANIGIAANPDAALLASRGFPGTTLIPNNCEEKQLGNLTVDVLLESFSSDSEQAARWAETFDRWGIRKLRALAALPEVPIIERLGQAGLRLQQLARGAVSRDLRQLEPRLIFAECVELEYPIVLLEPLAFLLNGMLEKVCGRLKDRALAAQELILELELEATHAADSELSTSTLAHASRQTLTRNLTRLFKRTLRLPIPILDAKVFLKLLQLDLQAHPPGAPIRKIHLTAEPARPRALQSGLFQPVFPEPEKLELTLARIARIVGEERVGSVELLDTHREGAFALRHFSPLDSANHLDVRNKSRLPEKGATNMPVFTSKAISQPDVETKLKVHAEEQLGVVIALRLFRPPLIANVTLCEDIPIRLRCAEREEIAGDIVWTAGPWRSSGDWAEHEGWTREEWDIALSAENNMALYRLVQDRLNGKWFLEGTYD